LALRTYTRDVKISIISHIGTVNFDESILDNIKQMNIDLNGIKYSEVKNTNFILNYFDHGRTLTLKSRSPDLEFDHIPLEILKTSPDVFVLVPLCNEISLEYVSKIIKTFPNAYIGIDLQGFIRKINDEGLVDYVFDKEILANMEKIIKIIGDRLILKGSEEEMRLIAKECSDYDDVMKYCNNFNNNGIYIMTMGEKGSRLIKMGENILKIPAFKAKKVRDETGAGDVYFSIFLYEFVRSSKSWKSIERSAYLASAAASFLVEKKGTAGFKKKKTVLKRLNKKIYTE
jgi:sugar/nucleoside kinase (ribokinase family)